MNTSPQNNDSHLQKKPIFINYPALIVLVFYPILLAILAALYSRHFSITGRDILIGVIGYYGSNITVGIGLHRLWAHGSYKTKPWFEFILMVMSSGCLQGPALAWASDHKFHHAYADGEKDPHTPAKYKNKGLGLLWSHLGWMILNDPSTKHIDRATLVTLGKKKMLVTQLKYYWQLATFMNTIPPVLLGLAVYGTLSWHAAIAGFLFVGIGRALQQQATFSVNSLCHFVGSRKYANDSSCDIWWMAPFLLGENWHNFHHAFGRDYRNGHKWYHLDVHKWIIWAMSKCGLAWDLVITPEERIAATVEEMKTTTIGPKLRSLGSTAEMIASLAAVRAQKIEKFISDVGVNICDANEAIYSDFTELKVYLLRNSSDQMDLLRRRLTLKFSQANRALNRLHHSAVELANFIQSNISQHNKISQRLLKKSMKSLHKIQLEAIRLGIELDCFAGSAAAS